MSEWTAIAAIYAGVAVASALIGVRDAALIFCGVAAMTLVVGHFAKE